MITSESYVVTGGIAATGSCVLFGRNSSAFTFTAGRGRSMLPDPMMVRRFVCWIERGGLIVPGLCICLCTPTGQQGESWVAILHSANQDGNNLVHLPREMWVDYGIGVLLHEGTVATGDVVRMRSESYAPMAKG